MCTFFGCSAHLLHIIFFGADDSTRSFAVLLYHCKLMCTVTMPMMSSPLTTAQNMLNTLLLCLYVYLLSNWLTTQFRLYIMFLVKERMCTQWTIITPVSNVTCLHMCMCTCVHSNVLLENCLQMFYVILCNLLETSEAYTAAMYIHECLWVFGVCCVCIKYVLYALELGFTLPTASAMNYLIWCICSGGGNLPGPENQHHFWEWASAHSDFETEWYLSWRHCGQCESGWTARWVNSRELWMCTMQTVVGNKVWVGAIGC